MRILFTLTIASIFGGCAISPNPGGVTPPSVDDFPQQELSFRVRGDANKALQDVQDYLAVRGLPSTATVRSLKIFVVTTYLQEPTKPGDLRLRRTSFRVALTPIGPIDGKACTALSVVSLTKSRGVKEEVWSVQDSDITFASTAWPDLRKQIDSRSCK